MPLASHLNRRDGTYYFRIRVPKVLIQSLGRKEIAYSLRTKEPKVAKELAYAHAYKVTRYFREMESRIASGSTITITTLISKE